MSQKAKEMTTVKVEKDTATIVAMIVKLRRGQGATQFRATDLIRELIEEKYPELVAVAEAQLGSDEDEA